jgi:hypothetical protein
VPSHPVDSSDRVAIGQCLDRELFRCRVVSGRLGIR